MVGRIRLRDRGVGDVGFLQPLLQYFLGPVCLSTDRIGDLHLENEMRATFEVQAQADSFQKALFQRVSTEAVGNAKNAVNKDKQDGNNKESFKSYILLHVLNSG